MQIQFIRSEKLVEDIYTLWFKPDKPIHYQAGQFAAFRIKHEADSRGDSREFTLSSSPSEDLIAITTPINKQSSSFKRTLSSLKIGDTIGMDSPMGDFVLPVNKSIPLVFIAKDMGVTPYRSIIKYLSDTGSSRDIHIIHQTSSDNPLFKVYFLNNGIKYLAVNSTDKLSDSIRSLQVNMNCLYYICGPTTFVDNANIYLQDEGISPFSIVLDRFIGYS